MIKKGMSIVLVIVMIASIISVIPLQSSAEVITNSKANLTNDELTVSGTNSLGNMLASKYEESAENADNSGNRIYAVEITNKQVSVDLRVLVDAQLIVAIFDEEGNNMYGSGVTEVTSDDRTVELALEVGTMPQYFLIRAFLLDKLTELPLCEQYENNYYTQKMQEFFAKTTNDFDADRVFNLDDSEDNNFLVYNDDTILIENEDENTNIISKADDDSKEYIITNIDDSIASLKAGDIFSYDQGDSNLLILKISSIRIDGSTATIRGDELEPEDVFDYIRIDAKQGAGEASVDNTNLGDNIEYIGEDVDKSNLAPTGLELIDIDATLGTSLSYKIFENGSNIKVNGKIGVKIEADIKFYYDAHLFEDDELEISAVLKYELSASLKLELKKKQEIKIPIGYFEISPFPGLIVGLTPALILEGKLSFELKATIKGQVGFGFQYGQAVDKTKAPTVETEIKISGELFIGLSLAPKIALYGDLAKAEFDARAGINLKATLKYTTNGHSSDEIHLCSSCIDGDIFFAIRFKFSISILRKENLTWNFDLLDLEWELADFYYSFDTGKFDFTECPNKTYKQTITLLDKNNNPVQGATINGYKTDKKGKAELYAPGGKLALTIKKDDREIIRWHYIDHAGRFTLVIDFDKPANAPSGMGISPAKPIVFHDNAIESGKCGDNVYFYVYAQKGSGYLLRLIGQGNMYNYSKSKLAPWSDYYITSVKISDGITGIGDYAFYDEAFSSVSIPGSVASIGNYAFYSVDLYEIVIPDSVLSIGAYSFAKCTYMEKVTVGKGIKEIGEDAFLSCYQLNAFYINDLISWCKVSMFSSASNPLWEAGNLYLNGKLVTDLRIPDEINSIEYFAFEKCTSIKSVTIQQGVTQIKPCAFTYCSNLQSVNIPDSVTIIDYRAFESTKITEIVLGRGVKTIGEAAFKSTPLRSIVFSDNLTKIGKEAFEYCDFESVTIPDSVITIEEDAFHYCDNLSLVTLGNNVKTIEEGAFSFCKKLSGILIPANVKSIGAGPFANCDNLTEIGVSRDNTVFCSYKGNLYNYNKTKLIQYACGNPASSFVVPEGVKTIGDSSIYSCEFLTDVTFSTDVTSIGDYALHSCTNLKNVIIPESVTRIGKYAFDSCKSLSDIFYSGSQEDWNKVSIGSNNNPITSATIHFNYNGLYAPTGIGITMDSTSNLLEGSHQDDNLVDEYKYMYSPVGVKMSVVDTGSEESFKEIIRDHLIPNTEAVLIILKGYEETAVLNSKSLLYIAQKTVTEDGTVSFDTPTDFGEESWVAYIFGECDHTSSTWAVINEATEEEEGLKVYICNHCGEVLDSEVIPMLESSNSILGDVDGDTVVSIVDATYIQRKLAGITIHFEVNGIIADTDEDGSVTIIDATFIQRWLASLQSNDRIGKPIKSK